MFQPREKIDTIKAKEIAKTIAAKSPEVYRFENYNISDDDLLVIIDALKNNNSLKELTFGYLSPKRGLGFMQGIVDIINTNPNVTALVLRTRIEWTRDGSNILKNALINNTTLQRLYIMDSAFSVNNIYVNDIAEVINKSNTISEIDLGCGLSDKQVSILCDVIKTNPSLRRLGLGCNNITDVGAQLLIDAIKENNHLESLATYGNSLSEDLESKIESLLDKEQIALRANHSHVRRR